MAQSRATYTAALCRAQARQRQAVNDYNRAARKVDAALRKLQSDLRRLNH